MKFKNVLFSAALSAALISPTFGNKPMTVDKLEPTKTLSVEISDLIKKIDFNTELTDGESIKLKFMVNENNEIIVLSTNNEKFDTKLKSNLNYKKLASDKIDQYQVYIVPIKLQG